MFWAPFQVFTLIHENHLLYREVKSILRIRKLRHREDKLLDQGHRVSQC